MCKSTQLQGIESESDCMGTNREKMKDLDHRKPAGKGGGTPSGLDTNNRHPPPAVGWRPWGGGGGLEGFLGRAMGGGGLGFWFWFCLAPGPWSLAPVCLCMPDLRHGNAERTVGTFRARLCASSLRPPALCAAYLDHLSSALHAWRSHLVIDLLTYRW